MAVVFLGSLSKAAALFHEYDVVTQVCQHALLCCVGQGRGGEHEIRTTILFRNFEKNMPPSIREKMQKLVFFPARNEDGALAS